MIVGFCCCDAFTGVASPRRAVVVKKAPEERAIDTVVQGLLRMARGDVDLIVGARQIVWIPRGAGVVSLRVDASADGFVSVIRIVMLWQHTAALDSPSVAMNI